MSQLLDPPVEDSLDYVQHLVLEDADWDLYEKLLKTVGSRPIRITYDDGRMEIMSPLPEHEWPQKIISRLIEALALETGTELAAYGSTTFRTKAKAKGLEPDECYYFRHERQMRARKRINLKKDPPPDLVLEVDITSRSIPREPIYAAMGVPELWRWDGRLLHCMHLIKGRYRLRKHSIAFPFLEPAQLLPFIEMAGETSGNTTVRALIKWVREKGWTV
jgi:Uma2 family endonuclease